MSEMSLRYPQCNIFKTVLTHFGFIFYAYFIILPFTPFYFNDHKNI